MTNSLLDFMNRPDGTAFHPSAEHERAYVRSAMQLRVVAGALLGSNSLPSDVQAVMAKHDELIRRQFLKFGYALPYADFDERVRRAYHPDDGVCILQDDQHQVAALGYVRAKVAFTHTPFADGALLNHASIRNHLTELAPALSAEWMATAETEALLARIFGLGRGSATQTGLLASRGQQRRTHRLFNQLLLGHHETLTHEFPPSSASVVYRPLVDSLQQDFSQLENGVIVGRFVIEDPLAYSSVSAMVLHNQVEWAFHHLAQALQATQPEYLATIAVPSSIPYAVNFASRMFGQPIEVMTYPLGDDTSGDFQREALTGGLYETFHQNRVTCLLVIKPEHASNR